jgi:hypothetical protein
MFSRILKNVPQATVLPCVGNTRIIDGDMVAYWSVDTVPWSLQDIIAAWNVQDSQLVNDSIVS